METVNLKNIPSLFFCRYMSNDLCVIVCFLDTGKTYGVEPLVDQVFSLVVKCLVTISKMETRKNQTVLTV